MNILVIGGTGFIGSYVTRELHEGGHEVTVFHRGVHESQIVPDVAHIRSPDAAIPVVCFPRELLGSHFDVVVHMIAMGESDSSSAVRAFAGRVRRVVAVSSGDVYRAYGIFMKIESGQIESGLLREDAPLRSVWYPYRRSAATPDELNYWYEKILVEREVMSNDELEGTVLRLPKVYGSEQNADLRTMYAYRSAPSWRWTHGYVENVAHAIALAAVHPQAANRIFNVGEEFTPTVSERLRSLPSPPEEIAPVAAHQYEFRQSIAYDTTRIRQELGYCEPVSYPAGIERTLGRSN